MNKIVPIVVVLLPILVSIKIAKDKRKDCNWTRADAANNIYGAILLILLSQFGPLILFKRIPDALSVVGVVSALLLWYGAYRMARGIYRKIDLRNAEAGR